MTLILPWKKNHFIVYYCYHSNYYSNSNLYQGKILNNIVYHLILMYNKNFFLDYKKKIQKKKWESEYSEYKHLRNIVCYDLYNETKKLKANFKALQSNIREINLKDTFNVLNQNLSSLSWILTELKKYSEAYCVDVGIWNTTKLPKRWWYDRNQWSGSNKVFQFKSCRISKEIFWCI